MNDLDQLEWIRRDGTSKAGEPSVPDGKGNGLPQTSLAFRIIVWLLIAAIAIYLLYVTLVHPLDRLKLQMLVGKNYTISVYTEGYREPTATVKVDGDLMFVSSFAMGTYYYEIDGTKTYRYSYLTDGEWQKEEVDTVSLFFTEEQDNGELPFSELLKSRNYKKMPGRIRAYRIKDKVDIGELDAVELYCAKGEYKIRGAYGLDFSGSPSHTAFYIIFDDFGETEITLPWEK